MISFIYFPNMLSVIKIYLVRHKLYLIGLFTGGLVFLLLFSIFQTDRYVLTGIIKMKKAANLLDKFLEDEYKIYSKKNFFRFGHSDFYKYFSPINYIDINRGRNDFIAEDLTFRLKISNTNIKRLHRFKGKKLEIYSLCLRIKANSKKTLTDAKTSIQKLINLYSVQKIIQSVYLKKKKYYEDCLNFFKNNKDVSINLINKITFKIETLNKIQLILKSKEKIFAIFGKTNNTFNVYSKFSSSLKNSFNLINIKISKKLFNWESVLIMIMMALYVFIISWLTMRKNAGR